jgi:hypothetical protein
MHDPNYIIQIRSSSTMHDPNYMLLSDFIKNVIATRYFVMTPKKIHNYM